MVLAHQGLPVRDFATPDKPDETPKPDAKESVVFADRAAFYETLAAEFARDAASGAPQ